MAVSACTSTNSANPTSIAGKKQDQSRENVIRIGRQKYGTLSIVNAKGVLEKRLAPLGISVQWL